MTATTVAPAGANAETLKSATETASNGVAANGAPTAVPQVPEWLNEELFVDLLQKNLPNFKSIKSFTAKLAGAAGENYATSLALVNLDAELEDGKTENFSYVIKLPLESMQQIMSNSHNIFDTESVMYKDVIPELEKMYSDAGVEVKFATKYYDVKTPSKSGAILMEDLRPQGFKNVNRLEGFDMEHTKSALKKLAQWHAATAVRIETKGQYPKLISEGVFNEDFLKLLEAMGKFSTPLYMEIVRTYEGHEDYYDSLLRTRENFVDEFRELLEIDSNEFNVLNHGDFWANNIMFQHDDMDKIKETYFVDYQMTRYGSPVFDLYLLMLSSVSLDVKLKHFDYFIKHYHDNLIENLKLLKYPKKLPTLKEIHTALFKYGFFSMNIVAGHMAIVLLEPTDAADMGTLIGSSEESMAFKRRMYSNPRYRKHAQAVLPWLYHRGAFW